MANAIFPSPHLPGFRLFRGDTINAQLANPTYSSQQSVTAHAGGLRPSATAISAVLTNVTTVASANDSVVLPKAVAGQFFVIANNGANAMQVFANGSDTINGTAGSTGVSQAAGAIVQYSAFAAGVWLSANQSGSLSGAFNGTVGATTPSTGVFTTIAESGAQTFTAAAAGPILKQGANGRVGTFVANGVTPVTVSNSSVAVTDAIIISLNTVGGTVGAVPAIQTITASTGFTVAATALDTSTYNYAIIKNAA